MINAIIANALTNAALAEKEKQCQIESQKFVENEICAEIENAANLGKKETIKSVPRHLAMDTVLKLLEINGFAAENYSENFIRIKW